MRLSKGVALVCETGTGTRKQEGGKKKGALGKEAGGGMEAKKKEGVSSWPQCCQRIVVRLSSGLTPRAVVATSMGDWKKGGQWGGSGPCWLSDKESTQLACERGQERYSPVPTQVLCNGVPALYSWTPPPQKGGKGRLLEWDRTGQSVIGERLLSAGLSGSHLPTCPIIYSSRYYCSTITRNVRRSKASACCESLYHIRTSTHPERYMSIHPERLAGLAVALCEESCQAGPPLPSRTLF